MHRSLLWKVLRVASGGIGRGIADRIEELDDLHGRLGRQLEEVARLKVRVRRAREAEHARGQDIATWQYRLKLAESVGDAELAEFAREQLTLAHQSEDAAQGRVRALELELRAAVTRASELRAEFGETKESMVEREGYTTLRDVTAPSPPSTEEAEEAVDREEAEAELADPDAPEVSAVAEQAFARLTGEGGDTLH